MGASHSVITALQSLLKQHELKLSKRTLEGFITEIDRIAPWFVCSGSLTFASWDKLEGDLRREEGNGKLKVGTRSLWILVKSCLEDEKCHSSVAAGQGVLEELQDSMSETEQDKSAPPPYVERHCLDSFFSKRDKKKLLQAFPVFEAAEGGRVHAPVEYPLVKELAESVNKYGVDANFTIMQLERLGSVAMTPNDWQNTIKAALPSMGQYLDWKALWHDASQTQARANAHAEDNQRQWTFDLLTGQGQFVHNQTNYDWGAYGQISAAAIKAWKALSKKGEAGGHLTKIIQCPQEPFSDFVARMTEAAGRIFGDPEQVRPMIEQLVYENASPECKTVITPRRNKGLTDWIKICQGLGEPTRACRGLCRAWGKPKILKTDNGPAYTSQKFGQFCRQMGVTHLTGLPYNPQGQGIIERAHRTLKSYLLKQKGGVEEALSLVPRVTISIALFTLNFLNLDSQGCMAADRHYSEPEAKRNG
ncbi:igE-binding protein-like [Meriones unguiculatus]|uniref:igE-binding protein-like n=1 Tax=Meriones unguiculatus TaxID=10047 RepID=UPI00293EE73C|nr:igE-binding protein-like [Meriones unguiculatus]